MSRTVLIESPVLAATAPEIQEKIAALDARLTELQLVRANIANRRAYLEAELTSLVYQVNKQDAAALARKAAIKAELAALTVDDAEADTMAKDAQAALAGARADLAQLQRAGLEEAHRAAALAALKAQAAYVKDLLYVRHTDEEVQRTLKEAQDLRVSLEGKQTLSHWPEYDFSHRARGAGFKVDPETLAEIQGMMGKYEKS